MMNHIYAQKSGFTLVEMVLVLAIILILASVIVISVSAYLNKAATTSMIVSSRNASFSSQNDNINTDFIDLGY